MKKTVDEFTIISNKPLNINNFHIRLQSTNPLLNIKPGQFTNVEIPGNKDVFLRRPFSIFEVDYSRNELSLLVKILGKGSNSLSQLAAGSKLSLIYPLGNGFTTPSAGESVLCIGGGSGVAPLLHLSRAAQFTPEKFNIVLGARSVQDHISADDYKQFARMHFTTEDGTLGTKGMVTAHPLFRNLAQFDKIYTCGPLPMMKTVAAQAREQNVFCEVSLENLMACGYGVCLCCIEPTVKGNLCVCTEGPVFNINDLKW